MPRLSQKTFTGGELSPSLYARNDLAKYANGLKTLTNGFVHAEGCVSNRAGLEYVCEVKDNSKKVRLIPFSFNTEQTYIIELGNEYARFIKDGGQIIYPSGYQNEGNPVEIQTPYLEDDLFMLKYAQNADVLTICHRNYTAKELSRSSHYDWSISDVVSSPAINPPRNVSAAWTGSTSSNTTTYRYVVTAVQKDTYEESERSSTASVTGHLEAYWTTSEKVTISWNAVTDAAEYNVYRSVNGIYGFIGTSTGTSFVDNKIEPDLTATAPIARNPFENESNPSCVNYFQQRKIFGCLKGAPQSIVTSQTGTDNNFNISRPLNATDSINIKLSEREVNEIRHMIGLNDLIVLTSGAEWKLAGSDGTFSAASPPACVPQSYYGSSHIMPVVSGNMVLYVQAGGSIVRDLGYEYATDSYNGSELTIFSNHLFENKQIVDMAYSKEPYRILWCVMSDGTVNALTYNNKQEVAAWHRHITKGKFESVAVIREGFEDVPYFVVKRTINGQTKRFIERMHSRLINNSSDGFFVDCGLKAEFENEIALVTGLNHLENETVSILAYGGAYSAKVQNGRIFLPYPAKKVSVGLPYTFEMETLNFEGEHTHGLKKSIYDVNVKVYKSRSDFFVQGVKTSIQNARSIDSINNAELLYSGDIKAYPFSDYEEETTIKITQPNPLPLTVTSITVNVQIEDNA